MTSSTSTSTKWVPAVLNSTCPKTVTLVAWRLGSCRENLTSPLRSTVVWSGAMNRTLSVNWPRPAVQRLKTLNLKATTGSCGTRIRLMTPIRKKLPVTSWRISSHRSEHCKSGRIRVACILSGFQFSNVRGHFGGANGVLHQHGDGHRADAAGIRRDFSGDRPHAGKIHVAHQSRAALGAGIGHPVHPHVNHNRPRFDHVGLHKFGRAHGGDQNV